jgi:hypothetical protein
MYAYVEDDPVNSIDPDGLKVQKLTPKPGPETCWSKRFTTEIHRDANWWLNEDVGMLALQVWFEFEIAQNTPAVKDVWAGIANVYRNRWKLSQADKRKYRTLLGSPDQSFGRMIYNASAASDRHFDSDLMLKGNETQKLISALNSEPDSDICNGILASFWIWPSNPFGRTISEGALPNPFGGPTTPYITYATSYIHWGRVRGIDRYVSTFFYRP